MGGYVGPGGQWVERADTPAGGLYGQMAALVSGAGIQYVALVTDSPAAAGANVTRLQSALDAGGLVFVFGDGSAYINTRLVIGDNTDLSVSPKLRVIQASGSNQNLLVTAAYLRAWTGVSLAWSSGTDVAVTWTAHGMSEGEYVWLDNTATTSSEQSKFKGIFRVHSVTDANTLGVHVDRLPSTAPTGTWQAKRATVNMEISGGRWDYNSAENTSPADQQKHGLMIVGTANSTVRDLTIANCLKYGVLTCANRALKLTNITVNDTAATTTSDSIKVYGPDCGTVVDGVYGMAGDDCVSVQTKEPAAYIGYMPAYGDCVGTTLRNIASMSGAGAVSGAVIYCSPNEYMGAIVIDGVHGRYAGAAVRVQPGDTFAAAQLHSATVSGVDANCSTGVRVGGGTGTSNFQIGRLRIQQGEHNPRALTDNFLDISSVVVAKAINVSACQSAIGPLSAPTWPTGGAALFCLVAGTVDSLTFTECEMNAVAANGRFCQLNNASSVRKVNVRDSRLVGNQGVNVVATPGQAPDILLDGCDLDLAYAVNCAASANVTAVANTLNTATVLVRQTAGTVGLTHGGNKLNGTAALTTGTVTATAW